MNDKTSFEEHERRKQSHAQLRQLFESDFDIVEYAQKQELPIDFSQPWFKDVSRCEDCANLVTSEGKPHCLAVMDGARARPKNNSLPIRIIFHLYNICQYICNRVKNEIYMSAVR